MATIPEVPASQKITPISGPEKSVPVPTFDQGGIQAESVFTSPFIAGEGQAKIVGAVAEIFNKAADKTAIQDSAKAGYEEQQARFKKQQQEAATQEAIINGIKLIAILSVITGLFFYLYKFQKNNTKEFFSKLKQLFLKLWNKKWGKDN